MLVGVRDDVSYWAWLRHEIFSRLVMKLHLFFATVDGWWLTLKVDLTRTGSEKFTYLIGFLHFPVRRMNFCLRVPNTSIGSEIVRCFLPPARVPFWLTLTVSFYHSYCSQTVAWSAVLICFLASVCCSFAGWLIATVPFRAAKLFLLQITNSGLFGCQWFRSWLWMLSSYFTNIVSFLEPQLAKHETRIYDHIIGTVLLPLTAYYPVVRRSKRHLWISCLCYWDSCRS